MTLIIQVSFTVAAEDCQQRDGRLFTVKDNITQAELVENLEYVSDSHMILIGLRKLGNEWRWITGIVIIFMMFFLKKKLVLWTS